MSKKTKTDLHEELEMVRAELAMTAEELQNLKKEAARTVALTKTNIQKQTDKVMQERKRIYDEAAAAYTEALSTARLIYADFEKQVEVELGLVAAGVREQVLHTLKQVFGDEL